MQRHTWRTPGRALGLLGPLCFALLGCGTETAPRQGAPAGSGCALANLTQVCTCDGGRTGAQVCDGTAWSACACTGSGAGTGGAGGTGGVSGSGGATGGSGGVGGNPNVPTGTAKLNIPPGIVFDWDPKTPFPDGTCEPGFYLGAFDGFYASPAAFQFPVPVIGDVNLTLGASVDGEVFEVSDGDVHGFANGIFPFSSTIVGSLDCSTGIFSGTLVDGTYNVFGVDYFFEGPLSANYNRRTHTFEMGLWDVEEPPIDPANPPLTPAGGDGTWNAVLQP